MTSKDEVPPVAPVVLTLVDVDQNLALFDRCVDAAHLANGVLFEEAAALRESLANAETKIREREQTIRRLELQHRDELAERDEVIVSLAEQRDNLAVANAELATAIQTLREDLEAIGKRMAGGL